MPLPTLGPPRVRVRVRWVLGLEFRVGVDRVRVDRAGLVLELSLPPNTDTKDLEGDPSSLLSNLLGDAMRADRAPVRV